MASRKARQSAYEARIARTAFLLTGSVAGAVEVIDRVTRAQPNPENLSEDQIRRLVVIHAREWAGEVDRKGRAAHRRGVKTPRDGAPPSADANASTSGAVGGASAAEVHAVALSMDRQHAEAWLFRHIEALDDPEISRATDSSNTAMRRHLDAAEITMHSRLGDGLLDETAALRAYLQDLKTDSFIAAHRQLKAARRKRRLVVIGVIVIIVALTLVVAASLL